MGLKTPKDGQWNGYQPFLRRSHIFAVRKAFVSHSDGRRVIGEPVAQGPRQ